MSIKIKETYSNVNKEYSLYAVDGLGCKTFIGTTDTHPADRQVETFNLERRLNGHIF